MEFNKSIFALSVIGCLLLCSSAFAAYIDNGDGTVTDTGTGLMWQQATAPDNYTWEQALTYCENLELSTYTDWRLPTAKELESLTDKSRFNPAINTAYFPDTALFLYWTSTTEQNSSGNAWNVGFRYGYVHNRLKTNLNRVRAVRSGEAGSFDNVTLWPVPDTGQTQSFTASFGEDHDYTINPPSYTKLAAGCISLPDNATAWDMVRDDVTGLVWEEKHSADNFANYADPNDADNTYTWYDGATGTPGDDNDTEDFINALNAAIYGGYADWRLPNEKELQTIVDYGRFSPAVNTTYFSNAAEYNYWAAASYAPSFLQAWAVDFSDGWVSNFPKLDPNYARAVHTGCIETTTSTSTTVQSTTSTTVQSTTSTTVQSTTSTTVQSTTSTTVESTTSTTVESTSSTTVESTSSTTVQSTTSTSMSTTSITTTSVPTTTTSMSNGCIDNDGDGYGNNCTAGLDCNDTDTFYNEICPDCEVKVIPRALGWFLDEKEKTRRLFIIGQRSTVFVDSTEVRWESDDITVLSKRVFFNRFMFMKVSIDGAAPGKSTYRALIGTCSATLNLVK